MNPKGLLVFCLLVLVASCGLAVLIHTRERFAPQNKKAPTLAGLNEVQIKNLMASDKQKSQEVAALRKEQPTLTTPVGIVCSSLLKNNASPVNK
jgi:hypothetical protein